MENIFGQLTSAPLSKLVPYAYGGGGFRTSSLCPPPPLYLPMAIIIHIICFFLDNNISPGDLKNVFLKDGSANSNRSLVMLNHLPVTGGALLKSKILQERTRSNVAESWTNRIIIQMFCQNISLSENTVFNLLNYRHHNNYLIGPYRIFSGAIKASGTHLQNIFGFSERK